jgi:hypothetical protein
MTVSFTTHSIVHWLATLGVITLIVRLGIGPKKTDDKLRSVRLGIKCP